MYDGDCGLIRNVIPTCKFFWVFSGMRHSRRFILVSSYKQRIMGRASVPLRVQLGKCSMDDCEVRVGETRCRYIDTVETKSGPVHVALHCQHTTSSCITKAGRSRKPQCVCVCQVALWKSRQIIFLPVTSSSAALTLNGNAIKCAPCGRQHLRPVCLFAGVSTWCYCEQLPFTKNWKAGTNKEKKLHFIRVHFWKGRGPHIRLQI